MGRRLEDSLSARPSVSFLQDSRYQQVPEERTGNGAPRRRAAPISSRDLESERLELEAALPAAARELVRKRIIRCLLRVDEINNVKGAVLEDKASDVDLRRLISGAVDRMVGPRDDQDGIFGISIACGRRAVALVASGPEVDRSSGMEISRGVSGRNDLQRTELQRTTRLLDRKHLVSGDASTRSEHHEFVVPVGVEIHCARRLTDKTMSKWTPRVVRLAVSGYVRCDEVRLYFLWAVARFGDLCCRPCSPIDPVAEEVDAAQLPHVANGKPEPDIALVARRAFRRRWRGLGRRLVCLSGVVRSRTRSKPQARYKENRRQAMHSFAHRTLDARERPKDAVLCRFTRGFCRRRRSDCPRYRRAR